MKKIIVAIIGMMAVGILNLNAAVTVQKVWTPGGTLIVPNERVQFMQLSISTDEAVSLESIDLESEMANMVFSHLVVRNSFGRVVGRTAAFSGITTVPLLERTILLPEAPLLAEIEGETFPGFVPYALGKTVSVSVKSLNTGGNPIPIEKLVGTGAIHTVAKIPSKVGSLPFIGRLAIPGQVNVGQSRFIGGFVVGSDGTEDIRGLMNIGVHTTGGNEDNIQNLRMAVINSSGWFLMNFYRSYEYNMRGDNFLGEYIKFPKGVTFIGIFGDVGESFSNGGNIALSTTPRDWKSVYGYSSGKSPLLQTGTIIGQTVRVTPSIRFDPNTGAPITPPPTIPTPSLPPVATPSN